MKIDLERSDDPEPSRPTRDKRMVITKSLPFYLSGPSGYIHKIRSGAIYFFDGAYSHTAFKLQCNNLGFLDEKRFRSRLVTEIPAGAKFCKGCKFNNHKNQNENIN